MLSGGRRSEVKEEGRAKPGPGDMSAVDHPAALARAGGPRHCREAAEGHAATNSFHFCTMYAFSSMIAFQHAMPPMRAS